MITLTLIIAFLQKLKTWVIDNKWLVAVALAITIALVCLLFGFREPKPELKIYDPRTEIDGIQRERDEKIGANFNAIDRQRAEDDNRIKQANRKLPVNRNVNAKELEEMLRK